MLFSIIVFAGLRSIDYSLLCVKNAVIFSKKGTFVEIGQSHLSLTNIY